MITPLLRGVLEKVDLFLMQSKADAEKIILLGAPSGRVKVTGNLKYDAALMKSQKADLSAELRAEFGLGGEEKLLIAGSTHPGEEEIILRSYKELVTECPRLRLLIAPRHVNRAQAVANLSKKHGLNPYLISQLKGFNRPMRQDNVLILDIMGKLFEIYSAGEVIFIGGSLIKKGGQNPLEAAYYAKAIIFGPYTHNFEDITEEFLSANAALQVKDERQLSNSLRRLLKDDDERKAMGERAKAILNANAGIAKIDFEFVKGLIS